MRIEVWLDFICPSCYIGKRQLDMALKKFPYNNYVLIQYKSYPSRTITEKNQSYTLAFDNNNNNDSIEKKTWKNYDRLYKYATEIGLSIQLENLHNAKTFDAHRLVKYANRFDKDQQLIERLFKAYFTDQKNIDDHAALIRFAEEVGLNKASAEAILDTKKYSNSVREDIDVANEIEMQDMPFFVFNEQYALSGLQSVHALQEAIETLWHEDGAKREKQSVHYSKKTTYCDGDHHCEEDD